MALDDALNRLERTMRGFAGSAKHKVADVVLYNLAIDVREQGEAVRALCHLPSARAALTNARAALEGAIDAAYLTQSEQHYDMRGARARVFELFEQERIQLRADIISIQIPGASVDLENAVKEDAKSWDAGAPGQGGLIIGAWEFFSLNRASIGDHWSGHSRLALYRELAGDSPEGIEFVKMMDVVYGILSIAAHPRPRTGQRPAALTAPDRLEYRPDPTDAQRAAEVAEMAVRITIGSLNGRQGFA